MSSHLPLSFLSYSVSQLSIEDEESFRHVGLYADLKEVLRRDNYRFRVLPPEQAGRWDRALLLNLTFWGTDGGGDVLVDEVLPADVVTHAGWHHLAHRALAAASPAKASATSLFMGEAIASAFDVYLVGRLLGQTPDSTFLATQVPAMAEVAEAAGLSSGDFDELLQGLAADPARAFAELRELLFDATSALFASDSMDAALNTMATFDSHRFGPLLHRYELSNWVLYARAFTARSTAPDAQVMALDQTLRQVADPLEWLTEQWVLPALTRSAPQRQSA